MPGEYVSLADLNVGKFGPERDLKPAYIFTQKTAPTLTPYEVRGKYGSDRVSLYYDETGGEVGYCVIKKEESFCAPPIENPRRFYTDLDSEHFVSFVKDENLQTLNMIVCGNTGCSVFQVPDEYKSLIGIQGIAQYISQYKFKQFVLSAASHEKAIKFTYSFRKKKMSLSEVSNVDSEYILKDDIIFFKSCGEGGVLSKTLKGHVCQIDRQKHIMEIKDSRKSEYKMNFIVLMGGPGGRIYPFSDMIENYTKYGKFTGLLYAGSAYEPAPHGGNIETARSQFATVFKESENQYETIVRATSYGSYLITELPKIATKPVHLKLISPAFDQQKLQYRLRMIVKERLDKGSYGGLGSYWRNDILFRDGNFKLMPVLCALPEGSQVDFFLARYDKVTPVEEDELRRDIASKACSKVKFTVFISDKAEHAGEELELKAVQSLQSIAK